MRNIVLTIGVSAVFGAACTGAALSGAPVAYGAPLNFDCLQVATPIGMNLTCVNPTPFTMDAHFKGNCGPLPMLNEDTEIGPFKTISRQVPCLPGVQSPSAEASMSMRSNGTDEGDPPPNPPARPFGL
ncbi:hypothetical protein [Mycobacteroides immunogenum]|uniref:Uncharacterized protein n=1 Tax=Mycobacteroides immunogenum TaxID=83262 RepID=A0A0N1CHP4_9MYCO|nr:hypothetical protein [Mycobacteroides immunogenum]AMT71611.1 hypothetical protein ABG82_16190 [Mycobacteroides immunogenum]ANO04733.1 hypothetical protein BAB75_16435 [Mycobacteroides immunogenum]KIU39993.1 hypothetical protein TL11_13785 [Mycobacteroides immunogenum]KPG15216.1 hypothetical protein AN909_02440 [Mycobacteroides immunogenum]KPG15831.1 hypothetical protein AN910_07590 [Mycobacteroides immunogenum]